MPSIFLTDELQFLRRHGFTEAEVYDGRGQSKASRETAAKEEGKVLMLTGVRCRENGHRIRTRAGHCAQCRPERIAFTARETARALVYIAGSLKGRLIKIGMAKNIAQRERNLRAERYGGFADWSVLIHAEVDNAQTVERSISAGIKGPRIFNTYYNDGEERVAKEIIKCTFSAAFKSFSESIGGISRTKYWLERHRQYEFDED